MTSAADALGRATSLSCFAPLEDVSVVPVASVQAELGMGEGRTNQNFVVKGGGRRFFVRIGGD